MYKLLFFLVFNISFLAQAQELRMDASEIENLKNQIQKVSKTTRTITADFEQYKHLDFLTSDIKTSGKMVFKAPNWVKWEYANPYKYSIVFKDNVILINDDGVKSDIKVGASTLFKELNELIINSVTGNMFDDEKFKITYFKTDYYNKVFFESKDKNLANLIKTFVLFFDKKNGTVLEVKMIEPSEDYTKIIFYNRVENSKLDDEIFSH